MPSYPVRNGRAIGAPPEVQDQINEIMYENADWASQHQDLIRNAPPGAVDDHPEWQASQKAKRYDEAAGTNYYTGPGAQKASFAKGFDPRKVQFPGYEDENSYGADEGGEPLGAKATWEGQWTGSGPYGDKYEYGPKAKAEPPKESWWKLLFHRKAKR